MKRAHSYYEFVLILIVVTSAFKLEAQTHHRIPVGNWVDRDGIVKITDEGDNKFSLTVTRKGRGNYTHGNGNVVENPQKNSRRKEGETVLYITLRRGKNKFPQIGYFDPIAGTLRFKGGMVWKRYDTRMRLVDENERLRRENEQLKFNLLWAERLSKSARTEINRLEVTGKNVAAVSYTDAKGNIGTLSRQANGNWIERNLWGEKVHEFETVERTAVSVTLHDIESKSHIDLKIDVKACAIAVYVNERKVETYTITGAGR